MKAFLPKGLLSTLFRRQQRALRRASSVQAPGTLTSTTTNGVTRRPLAQRARGGTGSQAYYA